MTEGTTREELLAKVLCGGLVISLLLVIIGAILSVVELKAGGLSAASFMALPFSFKLLIIAVSLLVFFVLLVFTAFLWRKGYKLVLKYVFGVKEEEELPPEAPSEAPPEARRGVSAEAA